MASTSDGTPTNEIVLVAGLNYPRYEETKGIWRFRGAEGGGWRALCVRRARALVKADKTLRVTLFDFFQGTREGLTFDRKGKPRVTLEEELGPLDFRNYRRRDTTQPGTIALVPPEVRVKSTSEPSVRYFTAVKQISAGVVTETTYNAAFYGAGSTKANEVSISVTDFYSYLRSVGVARPKTIREVHLFCHAFAGGPIFVNTNDNLASGDPKRDPLDKDSRASKDFNIVNLNRDDRNEFAEAFAPGAAIFIWGCNEWIFMKRLVLETLKQKRKIAKPEDKRLQFTWDADWFDNEQQFHSQLGGSSSDHRSAKKSVNDIRDILREAIENTYMQMLATTSGNVVVGGLPGTYSNFDDAKEGSVNGFMHIPMGATTGDRETEDFRRVLRFYKDVVGVTFEPDTAVSPKFGRGYGTYLPK